MPTSKLRPGTNSLLVGACIIIVIAGLKAAAPLITPLLISLFFSVLCIPPMLRLQKRGVSELLSILIVVTASSGLLIGTLLIIGGSLAGFEERIPQYRQSLDAHMQSLLAWLHGRGIKLNIVDVQNQLDSAAILDLVKNLGAALGAALSQFVIVLLTMVFMLVEASGFPEKLRRSMGKPDGDLEQWRTAMQQVQQYVAIKAGVSLVTGSLAALLTFALGVDFPLLWGLIAFLFNFIPNIGSVIAAAPPMLLALVQYDAFSATLVGLGYIAINMVMGNIVEPRLMGKQLGLSTLVVFLSLIFWNWVWGPVGMVLSVPLTVILKILLEHSEDFRGVAIMLGPSQPNQVK